MDFVFNTISADCTQLSNENSIRELITEWVCSLNLYFGESGSLLADQAFYSFSVNATYGIQDWLSDQFVRKEVKQRFRSFQNRYLHIVDFQDYSRKVHFLYEQQRILAPCGTVAIEQDIPLLSLATDPAWSDSKICGYIDLQDDPVDINNVANEAHYRKLAAQLFQNRQSSIFSGQDLWEQRESLFPNLVFCNSVKQQLYESPHRTHIQKIVSRLSILNEYYNLYPTYQTKLLSGARTESDSVKNDPSLKSERKFTKPDGTSDYFYEHISFSGDYSGRIHFLPDDNNKRIYVGYVGKHLRTQKY